MFSRRTRSAGTGRRGSAAALAALALTVALACPAAERLAGAKPAVPRARQLAEKASASEIAARFGESADLYLQAAAASAEDAVRAAKKKDAGGANAMWAEAEFLLEKGCALYEKISGRKRSLTQLRRLAKLARSRPVLGARVSWRLAEAWRAAGEDKAAAKELSRLGFVTEWRIVGPFDNERGQGFDRVYGPEKETDFKAEYAGKKRKVRWRRNPLRAADGLVDLAGMFRPDREAVAYLLTFIEVGGRADVPAAVRLGSADGVRAWLNGRRVFEREADREPGFDQDVFGVTLRPGWNALLVKVAQSDGSWGLRLRLTDPAGARLDDVDFDASRLRAHAAPAAKIPEVSRGAMEHFQRRARSNPKDADALMRLGFLTARLAAFDREGGARPDREILERATKARPADARLWYELSFLSTVGGRMSAETNQNPRRDALERSAKLAPSAATELELADYYLRRYRNFKKAGRHLSRARGRSPDSLEVKLLAVELAAARGDRAEALAGAARLVKFNPDDPRPREVRARLLAEAGNPARACESYAAALRLDSSGKLLGAAGEQFEQSGQSYRSLEILETLLWRRPYDAGLRLERAGLLAGRGDYGAAVGECRKGLAVAPEDHRLLARLGEYLDWLGKKRDARAARRRALELMPNYVELERYVEYLEGRPGYDRKYREDSAELLKSAARVTGKAGDQAAYLLYKVIDRVYPDGTNSRTVHVMAKILSEHGARRFASRQVVYYAGEQRAAIRTARVHRAGGGSERAKILPERSYVRAERRIGVRRVHFPSPAVGDVVELEYRVDDLEQGFFGRYFGSTFQFRRAMPVLRSRYVLIVPRELEIYFRAVRCDLAPRRSEDRREKARVYTWTAENQPKIAREAMMPPLGEISPAVQVSTYKDWKSFGKWYWGLIRKQHQPGPGVRKKARELGAGAKTEMQKIAAVYNYVVTDIRYVAWEFGVHGFQPYRVEQILERKFGDCKDKSTLICAMLAENGITAHPVLIRSQTRRQNQDLTLPLISHFNHCIVYVPPGEGRPELWLDGTAAASSTDALPDADRGAKVAVITPEGAVVRRIPQSSPALNATSETFVMSLKPDGSGSGEVRATAGGDRSAVMRTAFRNPLLRTRILNRLHGRRNPGASSGSVGFSDLKDLNVPVSYKYSLQLPKLARERDGLLELELPDSPLRGVLGYGGRDDLFAARFATYAPGASRRHDLVLPAAWRHSARYEISLPPGWKTAELPADARLVTEFGQLVVTRKFEAGRLTVAKTLELAATRVPVAKYAEFRKFCLALDRLEGIRIQLIKGEPPKKPGGGKKNGGGK
jgi:Flp pilus assembly protein TadD/transglutaminase-like putative cysteine protease